MKRILLTQWLGRALDPRAYGDSLSKLTQFNQKRKKDGGAARGNEEREKREDREREKREREKKGVENTIEEEEEHHRLPLLVV